MALTTKINVKMIREIAVRRHQVDLSWAEAEKIHEKIIAVIGENLDCEILRLRNERSERQKP